MDSSFATRRRSNNSLPHLLLNAQHAIAATGRVGGRIEIGTRSSRKEVTLEIRDDGCGIPAEIHARIFDPFFTTKPVGEGTGLSLSISHTIVSDHGAASSSKAPPATGRVSASPSPWKAKE